MLFKRVSARLSPNTATLIAVAKGPGRFRSSPTAGEGSRASLALEAIQFRISATLAGAASQLSVKREGREPKLCIASNAKSRAKGRFFSSFNSAGSREDLIVNELRDPGPSMPHSRPRRYGTASLKIFSAASVRPPQVEV